MAMINVEVQRTIRRPVAIVSRQFGDIQHHIKRVLKPLFEIAIRKAVEKGLEEDRRDLEERGYGT